MIWTSGPDRLCTFFNKGWLDFTGRSMEDELGNGWSEGVHPEDCDRCIAVYHSSFDARQDFQMEYRLRAKDGNYRWILDRGIPLFGRDRQFEGYIGSCIDITDLKLAQQADLERQKLESIGLLAAGIAHDFNNLLSGIIAQTDLALLESDSQASPLEQIQQIKTSALRASEIVRQLMVYAGRDMAEFGPVDISALIEDTVDLLRVSISKNVVLKTDLEKHIPAIAGHAAQIRQVIMNLIINGSEASETPRA
jgi:PAS domain S-box-containing protein